MNVSDASLASFLAAVVVASAALDLLWSWVAGRLEDAASL